MLKQADQGIATEGIDRDAALARYRAILASILDPVITIDAHGTIRAASNSVEGTFGWTPAQLVGRDISVLMPEPHRSRHPGYLAEYRRTGETSILGRTREFEGLRRDGTTFPLEISVSRVDIPGGDEPLFTGVLRDISPRKRAERALYESERRFRKILEDVKLVAVTLDIDGRVTFVNDFLLHLTGWRRDELVGRDWFDVFVPDDERQRVRETFANGIRRAEIEPHYENHILTRSGARRLIAWNNTVLRDPEGRVVGATGIGADIGERRRAEKELRLLQSLTLAIARAGGLHTAMVTTLEQICEATGWSYGEAWLPGADGTVLESTPAWHARDARLAGFASTTRGTRFARGEGLPGRAWASRRPEWLGDLSSENLFGRSEAASLAGFQAGVAVPILSGGEVIAVVAFFMTEPREEDRRQLDLVSAAVASLGPVIERKSADDELRRHREQLEELVAERTKELEASHVQLRLADRLASIGTLAAGVGHDMNNVLLPVRCRLDALDAQNLTPKARKHFSEVRKSVAYLQQLADGLHMLSLDPVHADGAGECTELDEWWDRMGPLLARGLPRHVRLATSWPSNLPPVAVAPQGMTQAVLNLVVNAGEAVGEDGKVRIWAEPDADRQFVRLGVSDNGRGMSPEVRRRALDPFFTTKARDLGTGLGLSLVQGVAGSAGGSVEIDSAEGKGTTIVLTLPLKQAVAPRAAEAPNLAAAVSVADARLSSFASTLLEAWGFDVRRAGAEGPAGCDLWVTDATPRACDQAAAYLNDPGRRVLVLGACSSGWRATGATVVEDPQDFEALREGICDAATYLCGDHDDPPTDPNPVRR